MWIQIITVIIILIIALVWLEKENYAGYFYRPAQFSTTGCYPDPYDTGLSYGSGIQYCPRGKFPGVARMLDNKKRSGF